MSELIDKQMAIELFNDNTLSLDDGAYVQERLKQLPPVTIAENATVEDCISRQALIEKATSWDTHFTDSERYVSLTDIRNAPSVKPEPKRWIPCSERLPEEDGEYLVTVKPTFKNMRNYIKHCDFARNLYLVDEYDFVDKKGIAGFYKYDSEYGYYEMTEVIAWCELPEPYKMCGGEE